MQMKISFRARIGLPAKMPSRHSAYHQLSWWFWLFKKKVLFPVLVDFLRKTAFSSSVMQVSCMPPLTTVRKQSVLFTPCRRPFTGVWCRGGTTPASHSGHTDTMPPCKPWGGICLAGFAKAQFAGEGVFPLSTHTAPLRACMTTPPSPFPWVEVAPGVNSL